MSCTTLLAAGLLLLAPAADGGTVPDGGAAQPSRPAFPEGDVAVRAYVDPDRVMLGQPFKLVVEVRHPAGHKVDLPESVAWGKLEPAGTVQKELRQEPDGKRVVETFRFPLQAFQLGDVETPELQLRIPSLPGESDALTVDGLPLTVQKSAPPDAEQQPAPMAPPVAVMRKDPRFLAWPPLLAFGGLLWLALWWLDRRRPHRAVDEAGVILAPAVPPHLTAARALEELRRSGLLEAGRHAEFVDGVIQVARTYLEHSYGVPVLEQTTDEAMAMLAPAVVRSVLVPEKRRLGKLNVDAVRASLLFADGVKFARMPASAADCARLLDEVSMMVELTRPLDEESAPPPVGGPP